MCNLTQQNYDLDWYCKAPTTHGITCQDWKMALGDKNTYVSKTDMEFIITYQHRELQQTLELQVEGVNELISLNDTSCHMWPKEDSWNTHPSGFYYKGRWQNVRCKITNNVPIPRYKRCFANRQLLLIGDSNVRIIGTRIINEMEFRLLKGNATSSIPQDILAYDKNNNITLSMFPHQLPYYAHRFVDKTVFVSAAKRLDDIPAGDNRIILIHLWLHMLRSSVDTFRYHVRHIRQAIERLIQRSPNVHISIKGPHAYNYKDQLPVDYMAS
ncbi:NXPE family member 3-like [Mizuhopecten yessoensis]|uniref:NXPE family member 3-like n=1 Tax=Mizuhopecten yessoensis TaxID=6573 RepID=UPI000B45ECE0|nr:NXPE family member 3-like [Mizuhopecten yessoensis]